MKGGRTSGTWESNSKWQHGETKTIRVPAALVLEILEYARWLDQHNKSSLRHQSRAEFSCNLILQAIDKYIEWRRSSYYHANQHCKEPNINSRGWDELQKFRAMVASEEIGIKS